VTPIITGPRNGEQATLCVEEWFYLLFPALAFALAVAIGGGRAYLGSAVAVASASVALRAWFLFMLDCPTNTERYGTLLRLDSLVFGAVAAHAAVRWPARWAASRRPAAFAGFAIVAVAIWLRAGLYQAGPIIRLAYPDVIALGTVLLLPWLSSWKASDGKAAAFVTSVSLYSYSLYLVHPLVQGASAVILGPPRGLVAGIVMTPLWYASSYAVAALNYHFFESRMTKLRDVDLSAGFRRLARAIDRASVVTAPARDRAPSWGVAVEYRDIENRAKSRHHKAGFGRREKGTQRIFERGVKRPVK
jgi:peptidoglycan/LPS O-acetylase OafA/YrhL